MESCFAVNCGSNSFRKQKKWWCKFFRLPKDKKLKKKMLDQYKKRKLFEAATGGVL